MKCKEFNRTPSGDWPCSIEEDLFISESLKELEQERRAAESARKR